MPNWSKALEVAQSEKGLHYYYPKVPFECRLPGGLVDGRKIYVHAISPPNSQRFAVNLLTGSNSSSDDLAFHLNPRFDEDDVVMNSRASEEWGGEERTGKMPLMRMSPFLICITTMQQGYEVEVNNEWLAVFDHRLPFDKVTNLHIEGDIQVIGVHILNNEIYKDNLISIPGGVEASQMFTVAGKCDSECNGFYLNLQCGNSVEDDVAFHFNPRSGDGKVIRNSYISGSWGDEERDGDFPFGSGQVFSISITTLVDGFNVNVNGKPFTKYAHRLPISRICKLTLQGDAKMRDVTVELPSSIQLPSHYIKAELIEPSLPAKVEISDFKPGCALNVIGLIHKEPTRFKINLQSGPDEEDDVMLHLNPRWDQGEPKMVINSRVGGDWGSEEMWTEAFPFEASSGFEINLQCEEDGYRIVIDGFEQTFKHRIDCSRVTHAFVNGCIELKRILVSN